MGSKYTNQTESGYNSSAPPDDGSVQASNKVRWSFIKSKIGDPVLALAQAINSALVTFTNFGSRAVSSTDSVTAADHMKTIECTGTFTESLPDATATGPGFITTIRNVSTGLVTIALTTATDTLNGTVNGTILLGAGGSIKLKTNAAANGYYQEGAADLGTCTTASTFSWSGGGSTSGSVTMSWTRRGQWGILNVPNVTANTGTGSIFFSSDTVLPASMRPATTQRQPCNVIGNNGAAISAAGIIRVLTDGTVQIQRDNAETAFTNGAAAGTTSACSIEYFLG